LAIRCSLLYRVTGGDPFAGLLSATQAIVPKRNQPVRQNREGLLASSAAPTPNPQACVQIVMRLPEPLAMPDDRGGPTNRTPSRQPVKWNYPGSLLSSASVNAITRIRPGVKVYHGASLAKFRPVGWAFTLRNC
jgi:hypothetical protein